MAAISNDRVTVIWVEGNSDRFAVFRIRNFGTADTWDASSYFAGTVEVGTFVTGQSTSVGTTTSTTAAVVTLTLAGTTAASGFLTLRGQASTGYLAGS